MSRADAASRLARRAGGLTLVLLGLVLVGLLGCANQQQTRMQADDEADHDQWKAKTVGDVAIVTNVDPVPVAGVGLVTGLDGTGGGTPPGSYRTMMEEQLKKMERGINVKAVLDSPSNALVLVSAKLPPGARKGDPVDVEISLPPQSRVTSLRGGYLQKSLLFNYENARDIHEAARNINPHLKPGGVGDHALIGHALVRAEGNLLVGVGDHEGDRLKHARIWGGGESRVDLPLYLYLKDGHQRAGVASTVADCVNQTFHNCLGGPFHKDVAIARNNKMVALGVPQQYRHNLPRYLRVVRLIPMPDGSARQAEHSGGRGGYRRRLEDGLLEPGRTVTAALRLEAMGPDSVPALKRGLKSQNPLVRFCSAEALAYLGDPSCGEELARAVEDQPALRAFALTALASLDEGICHVKLNELLACESPEVRYGAFRALRALDESDPVVEGQLLNDSFWLHRVAPQSPPLVHLSTTRRPEIVLFGNDTYLKPPFSFLAGEFAITAAPEDDHCTLARVSASRRTADEAGVWTERRQCSLKVEDVLRTMAAMGGTYPEVVEVVREAGRVDGLTGLVKVDALPRAVTVHELDQAGRTPDQDLVFADDDIRKAASELGTTPPLYEASRRRHADDEDALTRDRRPASRDGLAEGGRPKR
jgi:hypothetical protein